MAVFDFKKNQKDLYQPTTAPVIVDVPEMLFLMADGQGDPNTGDDFASAIEALYSLAYAIRMNKAEPEYIAYVVPPSEGFWDFADPQTALADRTAIDKSQFVWTLAIRQPDFVTPQVLERAKAKLTKKKPELALDRVRLQTFREGLCVQALHLGPYSTEPATLQAMKRYQEQRRFTLDYTAERRHHELYLSNPKTTEPGKMKTILRLPIRRGR